MFLLFLIASLTTEIWFPHQSLADTKSKILMQGTPFPNSVLYRPNDGNAHPGIVVLHGSEGGSLPYYNLEAQFLAAHGYSVLAFCWYNCNKDTIIGAFSPLENVELRNTIKALAWLKNSPAVGGKKVALVGFSRGAEQSVILGSIADAVKLVDAVAVHTPADVIVSGFNWGATDRRCWICSTPDVACFKDTFDLEKWDWDNMRWNPACGSYPDFPEKMHAWLLDGVALPVNEPIKIENFKKPVFITVGDKDEEWDFNQSVRLADRLKKSGQKVELHIFAGEHHTFSFENENKRHDLLLKFLDKSL